MVVPTTIDQDGQNTAPVNFNVTSCTCEREREREREREGERERKIERGGVGRERERERERERSREGWSCWSNTSLLVFFQQQRIQLHLSNKSKTKE